MEKTTHIVRNDKDTVFRMLFRDKARLLELYNAVNQTSYENPEELQIVTLENAVYLGMKNDVAFIIDFHMYLYEHQSTVNPNMPLRFLQYVAKEYEKLVKQDKLYRNKKSYIPAPKFYVFYNGQEKQPEHWTEYLSQSFEKKETDPALELKVEFFNINSGMNEKLMQHCKTLSEYMQYVNMVRKNAMDMPLREAVNTAIDCCIKQGILSEFLRQNKAEVTAMSIFEYDEEAVRRIQRQDAIETGQKLQLIHMILRKLQKGKGPEMIAREVDEELQTVIRICKVAEVCGMDAQSVYEYLEKKCQL